jgi:predicted Zn-dependent peptidase
VKGLPLQQKAGSPTLHLPCRSMCRKIGCLGRQARCRHKIHPMESPFDVPRHFVRQFDNGLVLLGEPSSSFQSAAFHFLLPAGCAYDAAGEAGLASLTCEMMLRGAGSRDSRQLISDLENLGVERGESVGVSQASFSGATVADSIFPAMEIYADMLRTPHLPAEQLEAGKAVCLQEIRGIEDEPAQKLMSELRRRHYPDPWGRSSHGTEPTLSSLSIDDVERFHGQQYGPQNAILAVAGRFEWDELERTVSKLFGDWSPQGGGELKEESMLTVPRHVQHDSGQSHIGLAFRSTPYRDERYFEAWAAIGVLSGGMSSRLFTEVREKRGLCYTVSASLQTQRDRAAVFCYAGTTAERAQETLDVTYHELIRLGDGIEPGELQRLKARIKSGLIMQQESTSARANSLARDWYHLGRVRPIEEVSQRVDALTAKSINAYLRDNPPQDFTAVTLGREPLEMPHGIS